MQMQADPLKKFVLVHGGARDSYQVGKALAEADLLQSLVTDMMWSSDRKVAKLLTWVMPKKVLKTLQKRSEAGIPSARIRNYPRAAVQSLLLDHVKALPFETRRKAIRAADSLLGRAAGRIANQQNAALLSYSYYAYDAFKTFQGPGVLFQVHPHPVSIRRILSEELQAHPDCADSLKQEWELALPEEDFRRLSAEPALAKRFLCASSFTRSTLVENGVEASAIRVVPYGVDGDSFSPGGVQPSAAGKLKLLFVGRINQRKGVKYLLQALQMLNSDQVEVTICGRVVDGLELFKPFADRVIIRPSVSAAELREAYRSADLFVFPSVAEGFGQVLLEALASGLPILSTTHTAAPDLIVDGEAGFIVEPRRPDLLAERIDRAATHRDELLRMRNAARAAAERFTWGRFRQGIVAAVEEFSGELYPRKL